MLIFPHWFVTYDSISPSTMTDFPNHSDNLHQFAGKMEISIKKKFWTHLIWIC